MIDLTEPRRLHVLGAGGAGMSAIATVLAEMGHRVSGSDLKDSAALQRLSNVGVAVTVGHDPANVSADIDAVTRSTAVPDANPEVEAARAAGVTVLSRAEMLRSICAATDPVAIAGTHGKTTTSSMLALMLRDAGLEPGFIIGGELNEIGGGAAWSPNGPFVVEADESDGTFVEIGASAVLVTNVEPDHLEHYGDFDGLKTAFERFLGAADRFAVVCADDPVAAELGAAVGAVTYGTAPDADVRIEASADGPYSVGPVTVAGEVVGHLAPAIPGHHNTLNALGALTAAHQLGVSWAEGLASAGRFGGVARRFERRGRFGAVDLIDDYAHLPAEVRAATQTARAGWPHVVVVFQPHRYSRTEALWQDFAGAFDGVDHLVVTEIYSAGEAARPGVSGQLVADAVAAAPGAPPVTFVADRAELADLVAGLVEPGGLCLTLGAGDLTGLPDDLMALAR